LLSENVSAKRLDSLRTALAECWSHRDGLGQLAVALGNVIPGTVGLIYTREPDGSFGPMGHTLRDRADQSWDRMPYAHTLDELRRVLNYPLHGTSPFAGKFVDTATSYRGRLAELDTYTRRVLAPNGVQHHCRVVVYRQATMRAWVGVFGVSGDHEFTTAERRLLSRALPAIEDAMDAGEIVRYGRADSFAVQAILDAIGVPTWLMTARGSIVHANATARRGGREARERATRAAQRADHEPWFAVSRIEIDGDPLTLVIDRAPHVHVLPRSLSRVAEGIANGSTDKEIALALNIPIATVRTYVQRIYRRLNVHSRVALARLWSSGR
jgi:hypothetical protein